MLGLGHRESTVDSSLSRISWGRGVGKKSLPLHSTQRTKIKKQLTVNALSYKMYVTLNATRRKVLPVRHRSSPSTVDNVFYILG